MAVPSRAELLSVWENARERGALEKAMLLLEAAHPEQARDELYALPVGERDVRLLALRRNLFGPTLKSIATCPACDTHLEFALDARELIGESLPTPQPAPLRLTVGDTELDLRPVSSGDLAAVADCVDIEDARRLLCDRCVLHARQGGSSISTASLSALMIERVSDALASADPHAELLIDLRCESCAHRWQLILDVASFLWTEIDSLARGLLGEVHTLAWAYGWREADIIGMSDVRRRFYLDRVS